MLLAAHWLKRLTDETQELLQLIGLSEDESRIYLNLLDMGERENIEKAVTDSGLPASRAEDAVTSLVDRGILTVARNELVLVPPRDWLATILEQRSREKELQLRDIRRTVTKIRSRLDPIYWEKIAGIRSVDLIEPLKDTREMELVTVKLIENAKETICIFAETFGWYPKVRQALYSALERKVKAKVLMIAPDEDSARVSKELKKLGGHVRLASSEWYPIRGTLRDESELVFLIWATKKDEQKPVHYFPHYTSNQGLIRIFSDAFKQRWQDSKPLETIDFPKS